MGCDAYADENGVFYLWVRSYDDPDNKDKQHGVIVSGLEPNEKLAFEIHMGRLR